MLVIDQIERLLESDGTINAVLRKLFSIAHAPKSRLILIGLTSRKQLLQSIQQLRQESLSPVRFSDYTAAQLVRAISDVVGAIVPELKVRRMLEPLRSGSSST
jgi:Cdc6-like AAA superfamily ATPase